MMEVINLTIMVVGIAWAIAWAWVEIAKINKEDRQLKSSYDEPVWSIETTTLTEYPEDEEMPGTQN